MRKREKLRRASSVLLAFAALAMAVWAIVRSPAHEASPLPAQPSREPALLPAPVPRRVPPRAAPAPQTDAAAPVCAPAAGVRCHAGDVWSVDGCGAYERKVEECAARLCRAGACEQTDRQPCSEPPEGRCSGDSVRLCDAGRVRTIDCAEQGLTCAVGDEGAECVPRIPPAERCRGEARCDGDVLLTCEAGRLQRTDCEGLQARCLTLPGARAPSCVALRSEPDSACGPCGCAAEVEGSEVECDGRDEDGDAFVDEGIDCGPVPVLAFVIAGRDGESSYTPEDVEAELARVNGLFAESPGPASLRFVLDAISVLQEPDLLELDGRELAALVADARVQPAREELYVPIVFTDAVVRGGGTPKAGVSTLPNGTCGGMQQGAGPELGLIAVGKARSPTTVAHEIGHFFGLCHTHDQTNAALLAAAVSPQTGLLERCGEQSCLGEGDGVCDTPFDPGPETCAYDVECEVACRGGDEPDALNLMGYYTGCRRLFSQEQVRLMQHTLALRRGWHACRGGSCACRPGTSDCPVGMGCRPLPSEPVARCTLDGPRRPGATCESSADCGAAALCLGEASTGVSRCARACVESSTGCKCTRVHPELSVCIEDLAGAPR